MARKHKKNWVLDQIWCIFLFCTLERFVWMPNFCQKYQCMTSIWLTNKNLGDNIWHILSSTIFGKKWKLISFVNASNLSNVQNRNMHQTWSKTQFFMFPSQLINVLPFLWPCRCIRSKSKILARPGWLTLILQAQFR